MSGKLHLRLQYKYMKDWEVVYRSLEAVKEEKWDHALELLNAALEVTSNQQRLYQARSETLLRLHRIQEAMKDAQKMIEINPNTAMVRPPFCTFPPSFFPPFHLPYVPLTVLSIPLPPLPLSLSSWAFPLTVSGRRTFRLEGFMKWQARRRQPSSRTSRAWATTRRTSSCRRPSTASSAARPRPRATQQCVPSFSHPEALFYFYMLAPPPPFFFELRVSLR